MKICNSGTNAVRKCSTSLKRSVYQALREPQTAQAALEELVELDPDNHWAYVQLLGILEESEDWDVAYDLAVKILKLESNKSKKPLARYKYLAACQLLQRREYHKARILLKEAIGLDPTHVDAYLGIGKVYGNQEKFNKAIVVWQDGLRINRKDKRLIEHIKRAKELRDKK